MTTQAHGAGTPTTPTSVEDTGQLRLIIEATPNAMIVVGSGGRIVLVNAEAESLFGYDRAELLDMVVEDLVPERSRPAHGAARDEYLADPDARPMGAGRELFARRQDGTEVPVEIGLNPIRLGVDDFVLTSVIDIRERLQAQGAVESAGKDSLRRSILASMPCSVLATDLEGRVVAVNPASLALLGYTEAELLGLPLRDLHGADAGDDPWVRNVDGKERERVYRRKDGNHVPVGEAITPVFDGDDVVTGYLAVAFDITNRVEAKAKVDYLANHDALTGLPNRTMLLRQVTTALRGAQGRGTRVALLLLDVDHFKQVNDTLGHQAGDELLLELSERIRGGVRSDDVVARLGGDEFVVVFKDVKSDTELEGRITTLTKAIPMSVALNGQDFPVSASMGGAVYPRDGDSPTVLLKHADIAMYRAKAAGRNNVQWFVESMMDETNEKVALSLALGQAMDRDGELTVVYQPTVDLKTGRVVGLEALSRWRSPLLGQVPPDRFIPVAEEGGMIDELGGRVLRKACADVAEINATLGGEPLRLAVNVSPRQFASKTLLPELRATLEETGLDPRLLDLEITEGILMDDNHDVLEVLHAIKRLGVAIVIDDFGQGYSSLAYLTQFPVDKLKIDRAFVWRLSATGADAAVVDAILAMANALSMTVVAEGVETEAQEEYLRDRGCEQGQGYLYSEAVSVAEFVEVARRLGTAPA